MRPGNRPNQSLAGQQVRGSRISGQAVPELWALAAGRAEVGIDLPGDITLQAADDLGLGFPFRRAALGVARVAGCEPSRVNTIRHKGMIGLAVTARVEPVAGDFP